MPGRASLQYQLAWRLSAVFLVIFAITFAGFLYQAANVMEALRDESLQAQARYIARRLSVTDDGVARVELPANLKRQYAKSDSGYFFVVLGAGDRIVAASSPELIRLLGPFIPSGTAARFFRIDAVTPIGPYFGYITSAKGLRIVVAQSSVQGEPFVDSVMAEFLEEIAWWLIPVFLIAVWIGVITIRKSLAPLKLLSETAIAIGPANINARLSEDGVPVEVLPMVQAVNGALDRLEKGFSAQRRFTADAAHQLRTPVALLQARIDSPGFDDLEVEGLQSDIARIHRVIAQLLRVARLDSMRLDLSEKVELGEIAEETLAELAPLALREGRNLALERHASQSIVRGSRWLLNEALTNLVENAMAYAPPGTTVTVRIGTDGSLEVLDRGPGIKPEYREAIFERFWQAPGSSNAGAGLGLAIVSDIARLHGGSVDVRNRAGGGTAFVLRLPADVREPDTQEPVSAAAPPNGW